MNAKFKDKPEFLFSGNEVTISGNSMMEDPVQEWGRFITNVRTHLSGRKIVIVNFKLNNISSSNALYLTNLFSVFNEYRLYCKISINWYYCSNDEDMKFLGETYQERNVKLKFKSIEINKDECE